MPKKPLSSAGKSPARLPARASGRAPARLGAKKSLALSNERPDGAQVIRDARLERFPNRTTVRRYTVEFSCPEFTCVCPASGFPDFATLHIKYVPKDWCVELKSLKLYINQYRDRGIFHEDVVNVVLDDLIQLLDPWEIEVVGDFNVRGNIKTIVRASHRHADAG